MGMDMWFVKLKDNAKWDLNNVNCEHWDIHHKLPEDKDCSICKNICAWENCEDVNIDDLLSKDNYYHERGFENSDEFKYIVYVILKEMNSKISFTGDPCLDKNTFDKVVAIVNEWFSINWNKRTEFTINNGYIFKINTTEDMVEYLNCAKENGFTMWFSF